jgi:hypothetical protein
MREDLCLVMVSVWIGSEFSSLDDLLIKLRQWQGYIWNHPGAISTPVPESQQIDVLSDKEPVTKLNESYKGTRETKSGDKGIS